MDRDTIVNMNTNAQKYGSAGWIQNANSLGPNKYKLYPTKNCTISGGREYVAVPTTEPLSWKIKEKYNII